MSTERGFKIREDILAKLSENLISVKIRCSKILDSESFSDSSLDNLSKTLKSFPSLDANRKEYEPFKKKLPYPYEKSQVSESF